MDRSRRSVLAALGAGMAGLAGCSSGYRSGSREVGTLPPATDAPGVDAADGDTPAPSQSDGSQFTDVYRAVAPSTVRVVVRTTDGGSQGSGAVIGDGHVVTNQHVVAGARHVSVVYADGTYVESEVVGADVYSDLAVVSVPDTGGRNPLGFARADPVVGTEVVVVGSPFGLGESVTAGVVSGVDRSLPGANNFRIPDAIQTDAAANPGNSGGPLVAVDGTPLGLVNSGAGNDITFAISGALMARVVPALRDRGRYEHAYMGIGLLDLTPALARANDLGSLNGVYVDRVIEGTPAADALEGSSGSANAFGREVPTGGDVVVGLDGRRVRDAGELGTYLALETRPGDELAVTVRRDGSERTVRMTLAERPEP